MSIRTARTVVAALTILGGVSTAAPGAAGAATPECSSNATCISVFSSELGTYDNPNFVEAVLDGGGANVGQPVGLKRANRFDSAEDIQPVAGAVSDFYKQGVVSAEANSHYGSRLAVQQKYAPFDIPVQPE